MKTKITYIIPLALIIFFVNTTFASTSDVKPAGLAIFSFDTDSLGHTSKRAVIVANDEESYINDIPFDTWHISAGVVFASIKSAEAYIDDIPFATETIAARFLPLDKLGINQEPESYVNDIPFNTHKIACEYLNPNSGRYCYKTL